MARHPRRSHQTGAVQATIAVALAASVLVGCTPSTPTPTVTPSSSDTPTPTSSPTPTAAALVPDGSAAQNLPVFTAITASVWKGAHRAEGRAYIDALAAAGFDKSDMQVTQDKSTVGNPAESIQFSVLWDDDDCLVGQVGPATGNPVTQVLPALGDGKCLLGDTRPIDW